MSSTDTFRRALRDYWIGIAILVGLAALIDRKVALGMLIVFVGTYAVTYFSLRRVCTTIQPFTFDSGVPGPKVFMVGVHHGNEPASGVGLMNVVEQLQTKYLTVKKGSVTIVPFANPCGVLMNTREMPHQLMTGEQSDANREYDDITPDRMVKHLKSIVDQADFVLDFHEGWGFATINPNSMGSGIYPGTNGKGVALAEQLTNDINAVSDLTVKSKFVYRKEWPEVQGSLREYADDHNIPYVLVETSGQDDVLPMGQRVKQVEFLAVRLLQRLEVV